MIALPYGGTTVTIC